MKLPYTLEDFTPPYPWLEVITTIIILSILHYVLVIR